MICCGMRSVGWYAVGRYLGSYFKRAESRARKLTAERLGVASRPIGASGIGVRYTKIFPIVIQILKVYLVNFPFRRTRRKILAPNSSLNLSTFSLKVTFYRRKFSSSSYLGVFLFVKARSDM